MRGTARRRFGGDAGGAGGAAERFWAAVDVEAVPGEVVAVGSDLRPAMLVAAYRHGCFPWPAPGWRSIPWCSPDPRGVLPLGALHVSRSLRRRLRSCGWSTTLDEAFDAVLAGCAARASTWITPAMARAYRELHDLGTAHSLEVWSGADLVGGVYGVLIGGVFSGESMFSASPDGSKVALVALAERLAEARVGLLDCQQPTDHLRSMGQVSMARREYLALLRRERDRPVQLVPGRRAVAALVPPGQPASSSSNRA